MNGLVRSVAEKLLRITHGRTTAFFIAFFIAGHVAVYFNKLTPTYIYFMATLGGLVLGHSIKEDVVAARQKLSAPQGASDADGKG